MNMFCGSGGNYGNMKNTGKTIIVASLGFEEKFLLRAVIRRGIKENDKVVVIASEAPNEEHDIIEKKEKAYKYLKDVIERAFTQVEVTRCNVDVTDFYGTIITLRKLLKKLSSEGHVVLNLSGGMRLLIFEILVAAAGLKADIEVEIETENSSTCITIPIKVMQPIELDQTDQKILEEIAKKKTTRLKDLELLEIPKATLWRKLNKLVEEGILEKIKDEYTISDLGRIWL